MKRLTFFLVFLLSSHVAVWAQSVVYGRMTGLPNQKIRLEAFDGFKTYLVSEDTITEDGSFRLPYSEADYGMGYVISADNQPFFVILSGEEIQLEGELPGIPDRLHILRGEENQWFERYATEHPRREQALSAWIYLEKLYGMDPLYQGFSAPRKAIADEMRRIRNEDSAFLAHLPETTYAAWFLPTRKLVSSVSTVAQYRTDEIPATVSAFRNLDYADKRLYRSGLLRDAIESHFWLLENSGQSLDSAFHDMEISIDRMMEFLLKDEKILNEVTTYLFDLLERHSLFRASEYLALKVLGETACTLDNDLIRQLETYRAMKIGNIAPDIVFDGEVTAPAFPPSKMPRKLSDLSSKYTLVVFGAGWCPKCQQELPEIAEKYGKWKANDVEVVYVSLDDDRQTHVSFSKEFPFITVCDFKKWESLIVKNYYVFATPLMFLLDQNRKILLRPNSVNHMDAWVDWFLVQGNPRK